MVYALMLFSRYVSAAPCREADDGQQKVRGLRGIRWIGHWLRCAVRDDEACVAALPALDLSIKESAACPLVRDDRQFGVQAGEETVGAI
jgi:hypothetical protein